jgi:hypothetical protein
MATALLSAPFVRYGLWLERYPLVTKSVTSGVMYAAGDGLAQVGEHYHKQKEGRPVAPFAFNRTRLLIFGVYGTCVGGPLYHYWFGYLDRLPLAMFRLRQHRQRSELLRAFATLKRFGVALELPALDSLPQVKPWHRYTEKAIKIAADQFVFSTAYTLLFFVSVGVLTGAAEKREADAKRAGMEEYEALLKRRYQSAIDAANESKPKDPTKAALLSDLLQLKGLLQATRGNGAGGSGEAAHGSNGSGSASEAAAALDRILGVLHEGEDTSAGGITWEGIWARTWAHTKDVYLETFIADCIVWPPLQLINFTFVPLKYQVLYVNAGESVTESVPPPWQGATCVLTLSPPHTQRTWCGTPSSPSWRTRGTEGAPRGLRGAAGRAPWSLRPALPRVHGVQWPIVRAAISSMGGYR